MTGILGAMMTVGGSVVSHIATTSASINNGTSLVVNTPSHISGDRIYVFIGSDSNGTASPITSSDGFTERASRTGNVTYVWSKVAGGSEPASYAFTIDTVGNEVSIHAVSLRNVTSDVIGSISASNIAGGVNLTNAGMLWCFSNRENAASITSGPSGMTAVSTLSYFGNMSGLYKQDVLSGSTGDRTTTFSGGSNTNSVLVGVW